jgi:hypothetical protein
MAEQRCWRCSAPVLWLALNGVPLAIDRCPPGQGDIGIQRQLDGTEIAFVAVGTNYRRHSRACKAPAFAATAPARKERP